ncbi:MAG: hypothetical protein ABI707_01585 [Ferruginibacter sp.]
MRKYLLGLMFFITALPALCQWNGSTTVNNIVANSNLNEYASGIATDGANGSIIMSEDIEGMGDIFAQKITSSGTIAWGATANPVQICVTPQFKYNSTIIADGSGGAFIAWSDYRFNIEAGEIFIQRISSGGIVQWGANGLRVTNNATADDDEPVLCSDGAGGVIVAWQSDDTTNKNIQSFAQHYNSAGVAQWAANGVQVCTAAGFRGANGIVSDGSNGAIIFFLDTRNDPHGLDYDYLTNSVNELVNGDVYAQRLNGGGARLWNNNGVAVVTASGTQAGIGKALTDGNGGAIFVFDDGRNDDINFTNNDIFAQRVNSSGATMWAANGVAITTAAGNQFLNNVISDGSGGIVAAFKQEDNQLFTQRITAAGTASWTTNGVAISMATAQAGDASMQADGTGNTIFAYNLIDGINFIRAQKLNTTGVPQWTADGIIVCNTGYPYNPKITVSDNGSAIIAWNNSINFGSLDIYASKVLSNGTLAGAAVTDYITAANGNWDNPATWVSGVAPPAGATVIIRHTISCNVNASCLSLKVEQPGGNLTVLTGFNITITH